MIVQNSGDITNKYVQGTIWQWENTRERKVGVQSDPRPVLIISNNTFNYYSPSVNCVTITSVLKESPVHVPVLLSTDSHVQCEQIHTIPKEELSEFIGILPALTLTSIKEKLRYQFDLEEDKDTQLLISIKRSIDDLRRKTDPEATGKMDSKLEKLLELASKGFGLPDVEEDFLKLMIELHKQVKKLVNELNEIKSSIIHTTAKTTVLPYYEPSDDDSPVVKSDGKPTIVSTDDASVIVKNETHVGVSADVAAVDIASGRRIYSEADKKFIADGSNSLVAI